MKTTWKGLGVLVVAGLCLVAEVSRAAVVYQQLPGDTDRTSDVKETPLGWTQILADSFLLTENARLDSLQWWSQEPVGRHQAFRIRFMTDNGGLPGDVIGSYGTVLTPQEIDNGSTRYTVSFAPGQVPVFAAGYTYWLSIAGEDPYDGEPDWTKIFYWAMDPSQDGYASQTGIDEAWTLVHDQQMAFRLIGTTGVADDQDSFSRIKALYR